jgi:hypothetical protein
MQKRMLGLVEEVSISGAAASAVVIIGALARSEKATRNLLSSVLPDTYVFCRNDMELLLGKDQFRW